MLTAYHPSLAQVCGWCVALKKQIIIVLPNNIPIVNRREGGVFLFPHRLKMTGEIELSSVYSTSSSMNVFPTLCLWY